VAGGPLIVAILISRFGYRYKLVTYTTQSANLMLREIDDQQRNRCDNETVTDPSESTIVHDRIHKTIAGTDTHTSEEEGDTDLTQHQVSALGRIGNQLITVTKTD